VSHSLVRIGDTSDEDLRRALELIGEVNATFGSALLTRDEAAELMRRAARLGELAAAGKKVLEAWLDEATEPPDR
jgi:hypothetical protein